MGGEVDLNFELDVAQSFELLETNKGLSRIKLNWSFDDAEMAYCALTLMQLGPFVAHLETNFFAYGSGGQGWPGDAMSVQEMTGLALLPPPAWAAAFVAVMGRALSTTIDVDVKSFEEITPSDADKEYGAVFQFDLVPMSFVANGIKHELRLDVTSIGAIGAGLVLSGSAQVPTPITVKSAQLDVQPSGTGGFEWGWDDLCSSEPRLTASVAFSLSNTAIESLSELHTPLQLHGWEVLDDPLGQYGPCAKVDINAFEVGTAKISIPLSGVTPAFSDGDSYPLKLLLRTSGGARIVTVAAPSVLTAQEQTEFQLEAAGWDKIKCQQFVHALWGKIFHPHWRIDPPPFDLDSTRLWDVALTGAAPGTRLRVEVDKLRESAGVADARGHAWASVITDASVDGLSISVEQAGLVPPIAADGVRRLAVARGESAGTLRVRQTTLLLRRTVAIGEEIEQVTAGRYGNSRCFFVSTSGSSWRLEMGRTPRDAVLRSHARQPMTRRPRGAAGGDVPWPLGAPRVGNVYLRFERGGCQLELYELLESRVLRSSETDPERDG